jgi:FkbM family methyltransferase
MDITAARKTAFCRQMLSATGATIGFADVGSGGPLKEPWRHLPSEQVDKFDFEPTADTGAGLPVCVSDRVGPADFHVAYDERSSSFHETCPDFVARFGQQGMLPKKTIQVECTTLDENFRERLTVVDAVDINVEGHDLHVLRGGRRLFDEGFVKLLKVEFELAEAWQGQGRFSDIETFMREKGFDLVDIEIGYARPVNVSHFYNKGEPVWGKGYFAPSRDLWRAYLARADAEDIERHLIKAIVLYVAAGLPGRAFDVIDSAPQLLGARSAQLKQRIEHVYAWARLDYGLGILIRLADGLLRSVSMGRA